jgi:hypothetical protein
MSEPLMLIENAVRLLAPVGIELENVPSAVELVHRSQDAGTRHLLHFVNFNGEMTRPIRQITPVREAKVTLPKDIDAKKISTLVRPQSLAPQRDAQGRSWFTIPVIEEYEVVVVEQ